MSYSRWSYSYWYTYWLAREEEDTYDTATFCICSFDKNIVFTAKRLREQFHKCLDEVKLRDKNATETDILELSLYMSRFLDDVEKEFN